MHGLKCVALWRCIREQRCSTLQQRAGMSLRRFDAKHEQCNDLQRSA
jgi:hypothetical protein